MAARVKSLPILPPPPEEYGPAMQAINDRQQRFAIAFWQTDNSSDAARLAGYEDNGTGALKVTAHRLSHNPKIIAAVKELAEAHLSVDGVKLGARVIMEIAVNPQHPKQFDAAKLLLGIGGISAAVEHKHDIKIEVSDREKVERLLALADVLGMTREQVLGFVDLDPAEYQEVAGDGQA